MLSCTRISCVARWRYGWKRRGNRGEWRPRVQEDRIRLWVGCLSLQKLPCMCWTSLRNPLNHTYQQRVPIEIFQSLQGTLQLTLGQSVLLPSWDSRQCLRIFPLPVGKRREICFLQGCARSWKESFQSILCIATILGAFSSKTLISEWIRWRKYPSD
jgi:hypothetical protein